MPESFVGRPFSLGAMLLELGVNASATARVSLKTGSVRLTLSRWRPIREKWRAKCHNSVNTGLNCTIFGAQGDLGCSFDLSFLLGLTSNSTTSSVWMAHYSVYWWVQSPQDIQDGIKFIWRHQCSILNCHPFDCCKRGYLVLGLSNSS